jgi:phosphatidylinositol phospholipase C delta
VSEEECLTLIEKNEACPKVRGQGMMSVDGQSIHVITVSADFIVLLPGFYAMLRSPFMDVFNPKHREIYMDMTQPMSHYFIDSSHNTYLALL